MGWISKEKNLPKCGGMNRAPEMGGLVKLEKSVTAFTNQRHCEDFVLCSSQGESNGFCCPDLKLRPVLIKFVL